MRKERKKKTHNKKEKIVIKKINKIAKVSEEKNTMNNIKQISTR